MPFEEVSTVHFTGKPTADDKFVIATTVDTYIGGIGYSNAHSLSYCLHRDHWPTTVGMVVTQLVTELTQKYPELTVTRENCHVWIRDRWQLIKGSPGFTAYVQFQDFRDHAKVVHFDGTILRLHRIEAVEPAV